MTGLLALTLDASAPLGAVEFGNFLLEAEWWDGDPFAGGQFAFSADPLSQSYQATVVPEPGTGAVLGVAMLVAGGVAVVRRRQAALMLCAEAPLFESGVPGMRPVPPPVRIGGLPCPG